VHPIEKNFHIIKKFPIPCKKAKTSVIIEYLRPSSYLIVSYLELSAFIAFDIIKPLIGADTPIIAAPKIAKNKVIFSFFNSANILHGCTLTLS
jgi:hypothetical protein